MFLLWLSLLVLALAEGMNSLRGGLRQFRSWMAAPEGPGGGDEKRFSPVVVIVPCRGLDQGFEKNMEALFGLECPDFRLIFTLDSKSDPAIAKLVNLQQQHPGTASEILIAGTARDCGQKVHNLLFAVDHLPLETRSLVLADSDIRPLPDWLSALTRTLGREGTGLASGFRWYLPSEKTSFGSLLRSAWNGGILSMMSPEDSFFGWGGALACARQVFDECEARESWQGSLSDDYSLSAAVRAHGYKIRFVPRALSLSHGTCSFGELLRWSARQAAITRVYHPNLWRLTWLSQFLYGAAVWATPVLICLPGSFSQLTLIERLVLGTMGLLVAGLSGVKAQLRLKAVAAILSEKSDQILRHAWFYRLAPPLCNLVTLLALARSLLSREIEWRGIRYQMLAPAETRILSRSQPE